jgi:hypothetical protein
MKFIVGKRLLEDTTLPDSVLELELHLRENFSERMQSHVRLISQALAFREFGETTYEKPYRSLSGPEFKAREIAKLTLMNWVTRYILQILRLSGWMRLPAWNWHKFSRAISEQNVNHLSGISIKRLAKRHELKPTVLKASIKEQLVQLNERLHVRGSENYALDPDYDLYPCLQDNCRQPHHFWISFTLHDQRQDVFDGPVFPWKPKPKPKTETDTLDTAVNFNNDDWLLAVPEPLSGDFDGLASVDQQPQPEPEEEEEEVIPTELEECPTQPASHDCLASLGLVEHLEKLQLE